MDWKPLISATLNADRINAKQLAVLVAVPEAVIQQWQLGAATPEPSLLQGRTLLLVHACIFPSIYQFDDSILHLIKNLILQKLLGEMACFNILE